jgi:hypothetical protein
MDNIYTKIGKIQQEIGKIKKEQTNPFFKSSYFDINQLLDNLLPLLKEEKLTLSQPLTHINERPAIATIISDGDNKIESVVTLPDIQDPQKMGSAITYFRRYALQSMFGLQSVDDDGEGAVGRNKKVITNNDIDF